jgi:hypothetical protein
MAGHVQTARPAQFRLPVWASEFIDRRSQTLGKTKTQVIIEAISCLRNEETQALMREGYEEMNGQGLLMSEADMTASLDTLPDW